MLVPFGLIILGRTIGSWNEQLVPSVFLFLIQNSGYLWYAQLRCKEEGWQLNPPVNRADHDGAVSLIAVMQTFGGHSKAINDLQENGLRAKTLDQNRNKLKIELLGVLGETLAKPYLFDTERDLRTGRYRYRLALDPAFIHLPDLHQQSLP